MAAGRIVVPGWMPALDGDGVPIPDAQIFVYVNRTTTLAEVFSNSGLTVPLANPVLADSSGQFVSIWQDGTLLFSVSVFSPTLGPLATFDDVAPSSSSGGGGGSGTVTSVNGDPGPAVVLDAADVGAIATTARGAANGVASLDGSGKVFSSQLPVDGSYRGAWNASTNTPTIVSGVGTNGDYYDVSVAGSTNIDGISSWAVNDRIKFNGTAWQKFPAAASGVSSVNAQTGVVVLTKNDIGLSNVDNTPDLSKPVSNATTTALNLRALRDGSNITSANTFRSYLNINEVRPEDYGAVGNGSFTSAAGTDDSAALQSAINAALSSNRILVLSRIYRCNSNLTAALTAYPNRLHIEGTGQGQCGIVFGTNLQLAITGNFASSGEFDGPLICLRNFSVRTTNQSTVSPIKITYTGGTGTTPVSCIVENVEVSGISGTCGFRYAFECFNVRNAVFTDVRVMGDRTVIDNNPGSKAVVSLGGFYIGGDSDPVDVTFTNCEVYYTQDSYTVAGAFEGVIWDGCTTVNCNGFIKDRRGASLADPLFQLIANHANTWSYILDSENRFQSAIVGNLFYNAPLYPNWVGLRFVNSIGQPSDTSIIGNTFFVFSTGCTAIEVSGSSGDDTFIIGENSFNGTVPVSVGINLGTGANRVNIPDTNTFASCTTPISGTLSSNKVAQSIFNTGSGVATMLGAGLSENKLPFSEFSLPASIYPATDNTRTNGKVGNRWSSGYFVQGDFSGDLKANAVVSPTGFYGLISGAPKQVINGTGTTVFLGGIPGDWASIVSGANFIPYGGFGPLTIGTSGSPWQTAYFVVAPTITSDITEKREIHDFSVADSYALLRGLPTFDYKVGDDEEIHLGTSAQAFKAIADEFDRPWGVVENESGKLMLRPTEILMALIPAMRDMEERLARLEA